MFRMRIQAPAIHLIGGPAAALCSALVRAALEHEAQVVLVDLAPWWGGADVILGLEQVPGVRWHDLDGAAGELDGHGLLHRLPQGACGERVLAHDRWEARACDPEVVVATIDALRAAADLLVVTASAPDSTAAVHRSDDQTWVVAGLGLCESAAGVVAAQWLSRNGHDFATVLVGDGRVSAASYEPFARIHHTVSIDRADRRDLRRGVLCGRRRSDLRRFATGAVADALERSEVAA